ncbi:hypothetical protein DHX103_12190 [Planococcus sp. X10-3]|uniref:hypothetical protein n=1 Tax=Planococcus sp. X10-3 TaxID=3061240 RepID=UPI003BB07EBF
MTKTDNVIAKTLQILGGIMIAAYVLRALVAIDEFGGGPAFEILLQGVILGMLLIGFGEVIKLMQGLYNQREPERPVEDGEKERRAALRKTDDSTVQLETRNRILDFYTKRNMVVDDIEGTPYAGYAIVHHDGQKDVVDLNNWELEILSEGQLRKNPELRSLVE